MEEEEKEEKNSPSILSPIGVIMLIFAILLDLAGLIILCFGLDDLGILDVLGLIFVGGLMFMSARDMTVTKGAKKALKKVGGKVLKRVGLSFLGELIPYFGGIAPCWTIAVILHFRNK
ncbi:hypothetical protein ISS86_02875 [Candidatus Microgenomates bacterium]|nr:hypothetical protein [Candidatus Microgenomates bacterium]